MFTRPRNLPNFSSPQVAASLASPRLHRSTTVEIDGRPPSLSRLRSAAKPRRNSMATALDAIGRSTVASARPDARRFLLVPGAAADPQALEAGAIRHRTTADNIDFHSSVVIFVPRWRRQCTKNPWHRWVVIGTILSVYVNKFDWTEDRDELLPEDPRRRSMATPAGCTEDADVLPAESTRRRSVARRTATCCRKGRRWCRLPGTGTWCRMHGWHRCGNRIVEQT
jgi:hypothetical protein